MMVLVDTSVFMNYFRGRETPATIRLEKIIDDQACITPIIFQELLQGARDDDEFHTLKNYLITLPFCEPDNLLLTHEAAAKLYFQARRRGLTIRSSIDCFIAQIAINHNLALLHDDQDFDLIAQVSSLKIF